MYYIYEIFNKVTGRKYIGQTINHYHRYKNHMSNLKRGLHKEKLMQRDYILYGENSFDYRLIDSAQSYSEAIKKEKHYMIVNKTHEEEYGYNSQDAYFNKYQSTKKPVNTQNFFYQKATAKNLPLVQIANQIGISRATLIRNMVNPKKFSVKGFKTFIEVLGISPDEAVLYMGWESEKSPNKVDMLAKRFSSLSEENQQLVLSCMNAFLGNEKIQERGIKHGKYETNTSDESSRLY